MKYYSIKKTGKLYTIISYSKNVNSLLRTMLNKIIVGNKNFVKGHY